MKKLAFLLIAVILAGACGPKPQYKTRQGKRKQRYYNMHQYDQHQRDQYEIKKMKKN